MNKKKKYVKCILGTSLLVLIVIFVFPIMRQLAENRLDAYLKDLKSESVVSLKATRQIPEDIDVGSYLAGVIAVENEDFNRALTYYTKVLEKDSQNNQIKTELMVLNGMIGQMDLATQYARELNGTNTDVFLTTYLVAVDMLKHNRYQDVISFLSQSGKIPTDSIIKPIILAWSYAGLQERDKAFLVFDGFSDDARLNGIKFYHQALLHFYFGENESAIQLLKQYDTVKAPSLNVWNTIYTQMLKTNGKIMYPVLHDKFIDVLKKDMHIIHLMNKNKDNSIQTPHQAISDALYLTAMSFDDLKMPKIALVLANMGLSLNENSVLLRLLAADLSQKLQLKEQVFEIYDSFQFKTDLLHLRVAYNLMLQKQYDAAIHILKEFEQKGKQLPFVYNMMIDVYTEQKDYQNAIIYINKILDLPHVKLNSTLQSQIYLQRALVYMLQEDNQSMYTDLEKAVALDDTNAEALNALGYELIDKDIDIQKGMDYVLKANKLLPNQAHILDSVAWGYYKNKSYNEALNYALKAVQLAQSNAVIVMHLGDIYRVLNQNSETLSQYRKALMIKTDLTDEMKKKMETYIYENE